MINRFTLTVPHPIEPWHKFTNMKAYKVTIDHGIILREELYNSSEPEQFVLCKHKAKEEFYWKKIKKSIKDEYDIVQIK